MYAIIRQGGKQYRISAGDEIVCEKVNGSQGEAVRFDKVLLVSDDDKTVVAADDLA
ncbi:MAG: 50S ribosomal protein L21, partial [Actinomycetota bacterium]|nr:50S ribosomal protein L21 [Actinomycetota bacterium]